MDSLKHFVRKEREICLAVLAVCIGLGGFLWYFLTGGGPEVRIGGTGKNWSYVSRFIPEDLAFQKGISEEARAVSQSPFIGRAAPPAERKLPAAVPVKPVSVTVPVLPAEKAEYKESPAVQKITGNADSTDTPVKKSLPEPAPAVRLEPRRAEYIFYRLNQAGQAVAIVRMAGKSQKNTVYTFRSGQKKDGLQILSISEDKVKLRDARGRMVVLEFQKPMALVVELVEL